MNFFKTLVLLSLFGAMSFAQVKETPTEVDVHCLVYVHYNDGRQLWNRSLIKDWKVGSEGAIVDKRFEAEGVPIHFVASITLARELTLTLRITDLKAKTRTVSTSFMAQVEDTFGLGSSTVSIPTKTSGLRITSVSANCTMKDEIKLKRP